MSVTLDDEKFLIRALSGDVGVSFVIPGTESERRRLIRSLMNMMGPMPASDDVLEVQDRYLSGLLEEKGVVDVDGFEFDDGICVWQGDITRLRCDAMSMQRTAGCWGASSHATDV